MKKTYEESQRDTYTLIGKISMIITAALYTLFVTIAILILISISSSFISDMPVVSVILIAFAGFAIYSDIKAFNSISSGELYEMHDAAKRFIISPFALLILIVRLIIKDETDYVALAIIAEILISVPAIVAVFSFTKAIQWNQVVIARKRKERDAELYTPHKS